MISPTNIESARLPVEASLLWIGVTWATIIVYETIYTILYMKAFPEPVLDTEQAPNALIRS